MTRPRLIKAGTPLSSEARATSLVDVRKEAARMLAEARTQAETLKAQAAAEGRERGAAEIVELLLQARRYVEQVRRDAEPQLRALAVKIAERILGRALRLDESAVVDVAREALRAAGGAAELIVRAHPDDVAALERGRPLFAERLRGDALVTVRADEHVPRGGCILETPLGVIDARLDVQLAAIERALARADALADEKRA